MPFVELFGYKLHYEEQGTGAPILLLHGNPSSGYAWRKVTPGLSAFGRVIAVDHMGFGQSEKPPIEYSFFQHAAFLEEFIDQMGLSNITLVVMDWGSALGFDYFARNPLKIRGIVFFEAILRPYDTWAQFPKTDPKDTSRDLFRTMREGDIGGPGWKLNVEQNAFITQLLPHLLSVPLTADEKDAYERPFAAPESRVPIWRLPKDDPIEGDPADMMVTVRKYSEALCGSAIPKLLLWSPKGATLVEEHVVWVRQHFPHLKVVKLDSGVHFFQESHPLEFVKAFSEWFPGI